MIADTITKPFYLPRYKHTVDRGKFAFRCEGGSNTRRYEDESRSEDVADFFERYVCDDDREHGEPTTLYRFFGADGVLLYVGITSEPGIRFTYHFSAPWYREAQYAHVECFWWRPMAKVAEALAIISERPEFNIKEERASPLAGYRSETEKQGGYLEGELAQWFFVARNGRLPITACRCFLEAA